MGFGDLRLIQRPEEFCYGIDAVILADFACRGKERDFLEKSEVEIADLGAGNGAVTLILTYKYPRAKVLAVEIQEESARLAQRNVELNRLKDRVEVLQKDILDIPEERRGTMDMVVSNPPYVERNGGLANKNTPKAIARRESTADLSDFIGAGRHLLRDKGDLYMIHRPSRLVDLLAEGRRLGMEPKTLLPVAPCKGKAANLVLVHYVKNGGKQLTFLPELDVYDEAGEYTEQIKKIYGRI